MQPDLECTLWPDGIPTWLGGNGDEWLHCCVCHDLSEKPWLQADWDLAVCVVKAGFPAVGAIMFIGLVTIGRVYRRIRRKRDNPH